MARPVPNRIEVCRTQRAMHGNAGRAGLNEGAIAVVLQNGKLKHTPPLPATMDILRSLTLRWPLGPDTDGHGSGRTSATRKGRDWERGVLVASPPVAVGVHRAALQVGNPDPAGNGVSWDIDGAAAQGHASRKTDDKTRSSVPPLLFYSSRSATIGSTRAPRNAGTSEAVAPASANNAMAPA